MKDRDREEIEAPEECAGVYSVPARELGTV